MGREAWTPFWSQDTLFRMGVIPEAVAAKTHTGLDRQRSQGQEPH